MKLSFIDTHTHLYLPEFENDSQDAVTRAIDAGVNKMIMPNVDKDTIEPMKSLQAAFSDHLSMAMGLHPTSVDESWEENLNVIEKELHDGNYVAVGEIGMDLYWDKQFREQQMRAFEKQIEIASAFRLPIIIHCREALDETLEVMESFKDLNGVFHSFGGTCDDVKKIRKKAGDFYFGINGIVTFKNSSLRSVLPSIGIDRILLETDSPYLSPVPHRGKRCESAYVVHTANYIAITLSKPIEEIAERTTSSAINLFKI